MKRVLLLGAICAAVYFPALNNGFIADDYVYLEWASKLKSDFWLLFQIPPNNFRMTSFLLFGLLKAVFGYHAEVFYVAAIFLHFVNCVLLWKLLRLLGSSDSVAYPAAALFAIFHAPQEAVLWAAAMGEPLAGLFVLLTLVCWVKKQYALAPLFFFLGLFSKESAIIVLALIPLVQWHRNEKTFPREYFLLFIPALAFTAIFLQTWSANSYIKGGIYDSRLQAVLVLLRTVNRLFWPWLYIPLVAWIIARRHFPIRPAGRYLLWLLPALAPYIFLTYQKALPSRHVYLASMVIAAGIAFMLSEIKNPAFRNLFLAAFFTYNIGYLWFRKDHQFEERAAPTTELLRLFRTHSPTEVLIFDFPYTEAGVANAVTWLAPGWTPDLVRTAPPSETCSGCVRLRWDSRTQHYLGQWATAP